MRKGIILKWFEGGENGNELLAMSKHRKWIAVIVCGILMLGASWTYLRETLEPTYKGHTMSEWFARSPAAGGIVFKPTEDEVHEALLVIGTNNLSLLVRLMSYDGEKSAFVPLFRILPPRIHPLRIFDFAMEQQERRIKLADEAEQVFRALGPLGAPAVPQLTKALRRHGMIPAFRALHALGSVGEQGLPAIIFTASLTNHVMREAAVRSLGAHTNSAEARAVLTKALGDPNFFVRYYATGALTGNVISW